MAQKELKWYDILSILFGIILGFADPITDILTLVEFYRADHKTWFLVGLAFIILPSVLFSLLNMASTNNDQISESWCRSWTTCIFGCSPLFPAFMRLRTLFVYLKKLPNLWRDNQIEPIDIRTNENELNSPNDIDNLLEWSKFAFVIETAVESAPQFIIQLYAIVVQQESVTIIQMVSLPVSFLSLAWASTVGHEFIHYNAGGTNAERNLIHRLLRFATHVFLLSSRLFAIALFTVRYKWWITKVLILHSMAIVVCDIIWFFPRTQCHAKALEAARLIASYFCLHWLRDDIAVKIHEVPRENRKKELRIMQLISNVLFVIENITMILLFYFSHFPHTWYSLPVTICVCVFAVLGLAMWLSHSYFLKKESDNDV